MRKSLLVVALILTGSVLYGQNYRLHTVFMYSFSKYIQWPENYMQGDFEISVLGDSPIYDELMTMAASKKVGDRTIKVSKINSMADLKRCHILFIPSSKSAQLADVVSKSQSQPTLLVTEADGLGSKGSCINFVIKDGKLNFELNQSAMSRQNLKASNELTRYAILI